MEVSQEEDRKKKGKGRLEMKKQSVYEFGDTPKKKIRNSLLQKFSLASQTIERGIGKGSQRSMKYW